MTDGRYDGRRGNYDPSRGNNERYDRSGRDERGFFDRARDEVSSWFGDDDNNDRQRDRDDYRPSGRSGREQNQDSFEQRPRPRNDEDRRPYTGRSSSSDRMPRDLGERYQPMAGDYARSVGPDRSAGSDRSQGRDREQPNYGMTAPTHAHDRQYAEWRERQISQLDRDYHDYRRENQSRFDSEFSTWRGQRQTKRQMLGSVTEHMEVVGSDGQPIGKVDHIRSDSIILTKNDSPDGRHHTIGCSKIDRVEDGKVFLDKTADEAKREFSEEMRNRALFERDDQGEDGPHMLNRSFSGTY